MNTIPRDYDLDAYQFELPADQIAQHPHPQRDASRLLILDRSSGQRQHATFRDLVDTLPDGALLVANTSRVLPARLKGQKRATGGKVEFLLLTPLPLVTPQPLADGRKEGFVSGLLRSSKPLAVGQKADFPGGIELTVIEREEFGRVQVRLCWSGDMAEVFQAYGHMPLPPYIQREDDATDHGRYQTVYADSAKTGSVAAPTAGLHFTDDVLHALRDKGIQWAEVTLYVGYGTFSPLRCRDIREHHMHPEYIELDAANAETISRALAEGRPVVAVGTTTVRTLESIAHHCGRIQPFAGWTDIFIYPGFSFRVVDHLLTNFHLPGSSLILMVAAFAGRRLVLEAYEEAVDEGYRFFSYGDAMFIV